LELHYLHRDGEPRDEPKLLSMLKAAGMIRHLALTGFQGSVQLLGVLGSLSTLRGLWLRSLRTSRTRGPGGEQPALCLRTALAALTALTALGLCHIDERLMPVVPPELALMQNLASLQLELAGDCSAVASGAAMAWLAAGRADACMPCLGSLAITFHTLCGMRHDLAGLTSRAGLEYCLLVCEYKLDSPGPGNCCPLAPDAWAAMARWAGNHPTLLCLTIVVVSHLLQ
jgi:hypothetical protein